MLASRALLSSELAYFSNHASNVIVSLNCWSRVSRDFTKDPIQSVAKIVVPGSKDVFP